VTRSVQLFSLLDILVYAHEVPSLPGVNWALISDMTFKDLVCTTEASRAIKEILRAVTSSNKDSVNDVSADRLSLTLHEQCFGFYSLGDKLTQEGEHLVGTDIGRACVLLRKAAGWWNHSNDVNDDSAFMRVVDLLFEYRNDGGIGGIVDVCIKVASNFGGTVKGTEGEDDDGADSGQLAQFGGRSSDVLEWEHGLYHEQDGGGGGGGGVVGGGVGVGGGFGFSTAIVAVTDARSPLDARIICYETMLKCIEKLTEYGEFQLVNRMISLMVASEDDMLHDKLYGWLLQNDQTERLIWIAGSKRLEKYLREVDINLLWRHFVVHDRHDEASQLMSSRACSGERISLDERLACFSRVSSDDLENKARREEAGLQKMILDQIKIKARDGQIDPDVVDRIEYQLLGPSEMFNDIAGPNFLWEICLSIMQCCDSRDTETIEKLWMFLVCECVPVDSDYNEVQGHLRATQQKYEVEDRGRTQPGKFDDGSWQAVLKSKLIEVGRNHYGRGSDYIVPIGLLVYELEGLRRRWKMIRGEGGGGGGGGGGQGGGAPREEPNWIIFAFLEIGVEYGTLLQEYRAVLQDRESQCAADGGERLNYLCSIVEIISRWIKSGDKESLQRAMQQGLRSQVDDFKAELEGLSGTPGCADEARELVIRLRESEKYLR